MDSVDKKTRSDIMSRVGQRDTDLEMRLRSALHKIGFRYRLHDRKLPGSPDLVFVRLRAVIFVHGCFWHAHGCKLSKVPSSNSQFWIDKFDANKKRDRRNIDLLKANGWRVMIVWGCAIKGKNELEIANLASQCGKWLNSDEEFREIGNDS